MKLSKFDLQQLTADWALRLAPERKDKLLVTLLDDLKEAHEHLAANSQNSSRPPRTDAPWSSVAASTDADDGEDVSKQPDTDPDTTKDKGKDTLADSQADTQPDPKATPKDNADQPAQTNKKRKVGHQPGAPGHGRTQVLPISAVHNHITSHCVVCGEALNAHDFKPTGAHYQIDLVINAHRGLAGIGVINDKYVFGQTLCPQCDHINQSAPGVCPDDPSWKKLSMNERGLVGPTLASFIVCLAKRMRTPRRHIQEFLGDWFGLELSTSTINRCIHEAGRAVEPLQEELVQEIRQATLAHADETPWKERGQLLWLWVITCATTCLFLIGQRTSEQIDHLFEGQFKGWLMSDGYKVYRHLKNRLRCWAHVMRKAHGLEEAFNAEAVMFGKAVNLWLEKLRQAVYEARENPPQISLAITFAPELAAFRQLCEKHRDSKHEKTGELAREFLNDWEAFWVVLQHPHLPLTNNEAERALRHWVIARQISHGTRTEQGTRAFALLASVIETCRRRKILPWPYLARIIAERRKGNPAPSFATAALAA